MQRTILVVVLSVFVSIFVCMLTLGTHPDGDKPQVDGHAKWSIVRHGDEYGYVDYTGNILGGYTNYEDAASKRDYWKKWSEDYDAKHRGGYWIVVEE